MRQQAEQQPIVFVIDDDASLRQAFKRLLQSMDLHAEVFGSAVEFLNSKFPNDAPACIVLDVRLPGVSGLEFQDELAKRNIQIPIIFITGHADVPMSVRAMKAGAVEFLTKPVREQDLLDAIQVALERDRERRLHDKSVDDLLSQFEALTMGEKEVMSRVTAGLLNKQIAAELQVSEVTVKVRRGSVMKKMGARSLADLVRMTDKLGIWHSET